MSGFGSFLRFFASFCIGQISYQQHIRVKLSLHNSAKIFERQYVTQVCLHLEEKLF